VLSRPWGQRETVRNGITSWSGHRGFGGEALHNTENVIALDKAAHTEMSRLYSSIRWRITGSHTMTVRQWLSGQSYEAQRAFGLLAMTNIRNGVW
jgi:hypothetical protein